MFALLHGQYSPQYRPYTEQLILWQKIRLSYLLSVAQTVSPFIQKIHRTISIVNKRMSAFLLPICTDNKPLNTDNTQHKCFNEQKSVFLTCCLVALRVNTTVQTVQRIIATEDNSQPALTVAFLQRVSPKIPTVNCTIAIEEKS